jgi:hypothetical protein
MLDHERVDRALRNLIEYIDYDLHKSWECDEETGEDDYHILVKTFIEFYEED